MFDTPRQLVPRTARLLLVATLVAGLLVSASAVGAAEETAADYDVEFDHGDRAWVVFESVEARAPTTLTAHVYDADDDVVRDVEVTAAADELGTLEGRYGDDEVYTLTLDAVTDEDDAVLVGVTLDDRTWENPYPSADVEWLTPAEREALTEEPPTTAEELDLEPVATDFEDDLAKFRVTNDADEDVAVQWSVFADDASGTVTVPADGSTTVVVPTDSTVETVNLYYDGARVDAEASNAVSADLTAPTDGDGDTDGDADCGCPN